MFVGRLGMLVCELAMFLSRAGELLPLVANSEAIRPGIPIRSYCIVC